MKEVMFMTGREEQERRLKRKIERSLSQYPQFINEWYYNLIASGMTSRTCLEYMRTVRRYLTFLNIDPLKSITCADLTPLSFDKYMILIQTVGDRSSSDSYKQLNWCVLNKLCDFLHQRGYIKQNYMSAIHKPKNQDLARINEHRILLSQEDFKKILNAVTRETASRDAHGTVYRDRLILSLLMTTGMRRSALASINIGDFDVVNHKLVVIDKGAKRHEYKLSDEIIELFDGYMAERDIMLGEFDSEALFISRCHERMHADSIGEVVQKYSNIALGKKLSAHKLRAGFCFHPL